MSEKKNQGQPTNTPPLDRNFDDLEDAFFASGDASDFWETADADELSGGIDTFPDVDSPGASPDTSAAPPEEAPSVNGVEEHEDDAHGVMATDAPPLVAKPAPGLMDEAGEFYNPSALHPSPDLIADDETEEWSGDEEELSETVAAVEPSIPEDAKDDALQPAPPIVEVKPLSSDDSFSSIDSNGRYVLPSNVEVGWREAARSLERAAAGGPSDTRGPLLNEAARIQLTRVGDWDRSGRLFTDAIAAGLDPLDAPKGYADVIASKGDFVALRDLLVARAATLSGAAAVEAYQDAAIVERSHLKNDGAAIAILEKALTIKDDWFTLRLLRELLYPVKDWPRLVDVLHRMAQLGEGARSARCRVEEGRIHESEINDLDGAAEAYRKALRADGTFLDGFLAAVRVAIKRGDFKTLAGLYEQEAERTGGANGAFWRNRAARASRDGAVGPDETARLYKAAIKAADATCTSIHREAQAFFIQTDRKEDWLDALAAEAELQDGPAKVGTLLEAAVGSFTDPARREKTIKQLRKAAEIDPSCSPAGELAIELLLLTDQASEGIAALDESLALATSLRTKARLAFRVGEILEHSLGDFKAASERYRQAAEFDPDHPFAASSEAAALHRAGDWPQAVAALERLANGTTEPDRRSRFWHQAATIQRWHLKDTAAADASDTKALETSSLQPGAIDALVVSSAQSGEVARYAEALALAGQSLPHTADKLWHAYRAARIYSDCLKDYKQAQGLLLRCIEIDNHNQPVVALLRSVSGALGDWQAVYDLRRVEAASSIGEERLWHLVTAAHATAHISGLDAQTVALEILDEDAQNPAALAVMERAALLAGDRSRLIGVYRRVRNGLEDPGKRTAIAVRLADLASEMGDRQLAIRSITRVLEASAGPRPYGAMGRLSVGLENWALAEAALHADGDQQGLARLLETTSQDQKRVAATWRSISKGLPDCPEAFGGLERALTRLSSRDGLAETHGALARTEQEKSIANFHALLAGHLFENEDATERAVEFYQQAHASQPYRGKAFEALVRIHSENGNVEAVERVFASISNTSIIEQADALLDAGAADRATALYRRALKGIKKKDGLGSKLPLLVRYEQALISEEKWPDVFESLGQRLSLSNDPSETALIEAKRRWVLSERMADSDEAWEFYRELHESNPDDADVLENLARIAGARGEQKLAIQFLDGLSNIAATAEDAARYQRRIAEVHEANDAQEKARSAFLRALDHQPNDTEALEGLKRLAELSEDWQGLVGVLTREISLVDGDRQIETARQIAALWETKLDDPAVAADAWRKVLALVPGDAVALEHLVQLNQKLGEWAAFIDDGQALVHYLEGSQRTSLLAAMGRASMEHLQREEEAIRLLDEASIGEHAEKQAAEDLERIHAGRGSWDKVVECMVRRAQASEQDQAIEIFLKAAKTRKNQLRDRRGAAQLFDEVLRLNPSEPTALQFKGDYLYEKADLAGAVQVFEQIERLGFEEDLDDFDIRMERALYLYQFGEALRRLGRADDAMQRYEQALELNGSHLPTLEAVGPLYVEGELWDKANTVFRQVLQLTGGQGQPERLAKVYSCLGRVEFAQGHTDKAIRRFDKALELQPNDVESLQGYASVLFQLKDWNNLLTTYNNIIYHASERDAFIEAYLMKGFVLDAHMSLADKAAQHYEKSLSFDASHPGALLRLAELAIRKDEWDRAMSYAGRALTVGGEASETITGLLHLAQAISLLAGHKEEEAAEALNAAKKVEALASDIEGVEKDGKALQGLLRSTLQSGL